MFEYAIAFLSSAFLSSGSAILLKLYFWHVFTFLMVAVLFSNRATDQPSIINHRWHNWDFTLDFPPSMSDQALREKKLSADLVEALVCHLTICPEEVTVNWEFHGWDCRICSLVLLRAVPLANSGELVVSARWFFHDFLLRFWYEAGFNPCHLTSATWDLPSNFSAPDGMNVSSHLETDPSMILW